MIILFHDTKAAPYNATYLYCDTSKPVKCQWQQDFTYLNDLEINHIAKKGEEEFTTLRNLLAFYIKRDDAKFKLLARGKTIQRLFERYPELLI